MDDEQTGTGTSTPREIWLVVAVLMVGTFLSTLDVLIIVTALPRIAGDLGGRDDISWTLTGYMLASTATGPLYGKLGDLLGRKTLYQLAIALFIVGSLLSGVSQDILQLTLARTLQGVGAGGLMVLPFAMIADVSPPRHRARYQSVMTANLAIATVLGPLVGGFAVDHASWRWILFANLPLGLLAMTATARLRLPVRRAASVVVDYLGSVLLVAAAVCLLFMVTWAGNRYPFGSAPIALLALAAIGFTWLLVRRERVAPEPVLPLELFRSSRFNVLTIGTFFSAIAINSGWVLMPLYLQIVVGASATNSGLLLLPFVAGNMSASILAGRIISRTGRYRWAPVLGAAIATVGFFLYTTLGTDSTQLTASLYMLVSGIGIGFVFQVVMVMVQNSVEHKDLGAATAAIGFFRSLGLACGAAIGLSIYGNRFVAGVAEVVARPGGNQIPTAATQGDPVAIHALPAALQGPLVAAFADALHVALLATAPTVALGLVIFVFAKEVVVDEERDVDEDGIGIDDVSPSLAIEGSPFT
jgi:EmrB/QacA subfamily drug resistance transporter